MFKITISILSIFLCLNSYGNLKAHIKYLSDDALEGRKVGTKGNELAVDYLVNEFKKMEVTTLGDSYKQDFTIFTNMEKGEKNNLSVVGVDQLSFEPLAFSNTGSISSEIVFAGFGISIPKNDEVLEYDDYKDIDVKGKIVVVLSGDPGIGNPKSKFRNPNYISYRTLFYKLKNAKAHGAKGLILIQDPLSFEGEKEPDLIFDATEGGGKRFDIIAGLTKNDWVNTILNESGKSVKDIQKDISKKQKPNSFSLETSGELSVHLKKKTGRVSNVVAFIQGSDEQLKKEVLVLGAHMDHLGFGGQSSMDPSPLKKIHNGADDNASGVGIVVELAKYYSKNKPRRSMAFVLFNAEESGLLGASHFVSMWARHTEKYGKLFGMLNFDMVGRYSSELAILGTESAFEWESALSHLNSQGLNVVKKKKSVGSSDHAAFIDKNIPALFFTTGTHDDYHKSTDDFNKINFKALESIFKISKEFANSLVQSDLKLTFNPDASSDDGRGRTRGYGAHLGCVPQFGQDDSIKGVVCVKTSPDSPALKAGIQEGDILVQIGDIEISSIYDLAFALKFYRAGDLVELGFMRGPKRLSAKVKLSKSKRSKKHHKSAPKYGHHRH